MRKPLVLCGRFIVAAAATWAVGVSLYIFTVPESERRETDIVLRDSSTIVADFTQKQSWYEAQGLWGVRWLITFSGLYLLAVRAAWRGNHIALAIMNVTAVALSIVAGFSIGGVYMPAALGLFIGTLILLSATLLRSRC